MNNLYVALLISFFCSAWLTTFHKTPWPTFASETLTFLAGACLLLGLHQSKVKLPRPQLIILPVVAIPLVQLATGQILYASNAILCFAYVAMFWLMVVAGFNYSRDEKQREKVFTLFCTVILGVGLVSSVIAICQWLNLNGYFSSWMYAYKGNRPYANLAQPNNLATLLTVSLLACLYFYEKRLVKTIYLVPYALILIFSIALTQSRTSWVVCLFILFYLSIKQYKCHARFGTVKLLGWIAIFIGMISSLPMLQQIVMNLTGQQLVETASVVERATSGYLRLDMWQQQWVALMQQPWWGYGWNQTGMAQIAAFDLHPSHEWYKSAHNILFDLLIWNGIPLGGLIIIYLLAWLLWLNRGVKETTSVIAALMVCAILIHGMLEFPLHYAYFLMTVGFLLGLIQAQYRHLPSVQVSSKITSVLGIVLIIGCSIAVRDYFLYKEQSVLVSQKHPLTVSQQAKLNQEIMLLTQFKERLWWIGLDPKTRMTDEQLAHVDRMVANMASKYDLYKYAQVLAFNGYEQEAKHQLWILETLHRQKRNYQDLLK